MGSTVLQAIENCSDTELVGAADVTAKEDRIPYANKYVELGKSVQELIRTEPKVIIEFTNRVGAMETIRTAIPKGIHVVSGSTGLTDEDYEESAHLAKKNKTGIISASNFSLGAVLLMRLSAIASRYFDYADIVESHHEEKKDAPSGTALSIMRSMLKERSAPFKQGETTRQILTSSRGADMEGINVHSVRLPGRIARHEVVLGAAGQTLTLLHDTLNREAFMPGVLMAVRAVIDMSNLTVGLDSLLDM